MKKNDAGYGFAAAVGNICLASKDPALAETISARKWYDKTYALDNSIFAPYLRGDSVDADSTFRKHVITGIELASVDGFAEHFRKLIWQQIFRGAMYLLFSGGKGVTPHFCNNCPYDLKAVYKDSDIIEGDGGLLSTIATPSVNIFKERIELNSIFLKVSETVKSFNTFSNALEISSSYAKDKSMFDVPGSSSVGLVSHIISVQGKGGSVATLRVSDAVHSNIKSNIYTVVSFMVVYAC